MVWLLEGPLLGNKTANFSVCPHMMEKGQEALWGLFHKALIPIMRAHLYNPIISQKPHLQILSSWRLGFQNTSLGGQKHSDLSNGQVENTR